MSDKEIITQIIIGNNIERGYITRGQEAMSKYTDDLIEAGERLEHEGFPVSAAACINAASRMKAMEKLILTLRYCSEALESVPESKKGLWDESKHEREG